MEISIIISFAIVAGLLVISPGPNGLLVAKTVATQSQKHGFANVFGFITAFYIQGSLVVFGLALVLVQSILLFTIVKYLGAAYLCWIGIKALREMRKNKSTLATQSNSAKKQSIRAAFIEGLLTNVLNPKTSMFYIAVFPQFLPIEQMSAVNVYSLVTLHVCLNAIWFGLMVLLLSRLKHLTNSSKVQRWIKGFTGLVFIGFGLKLATLKS